MGSDNHQNNENNHHQSMNFKPSAVEEALQTFDSKSLNNMFWVASIQNDECDADNH